MKKRIADCSPEEIEDFIKKRLLRDNPNEALHLRFNFDADQQPRGKFINRKILNYFSDIIPWSVSISSHKGWLEFSWQYDWSQKPIVKDYSGFGTRDILEDILKTHFFEKEIDTEEIFIPKTVSFNENELESEIEDYLKRYGWVVNRQVERQDCVEENWIKERRYRADLIISHPNYQQIGNIGIEIKNKSEQTNFSDALVQVLTKYQSYKFDKSGIIFAWVLILPISTPEEKNLANSLGVAVFDWDKKIIPTEPIPYFGRTKADYNVFDFNSSRRCTHGLMIPIEGYGFEIQKGYSERQAHTSIDKAILKYLSKRVNWWKPIRNKKVLLEMGE